MEIKNIRRFNKWKQQQLFPLKSKEKLTLNGVCLCSILWGTSEMAGREKPILHAPVPAWLSASALTLSPDPVGMGAATRLSLQGSSVQAGDASEEGTPPKHRDSRGSTLQKLEGVPGRCFISNFKGRLRSCVFLFSFLWFSLANVLGPFLFVLKSTSLKTLCQHVLFV